MTKFLVLFVYFLSPLVIKADEDRAAVINSTFMIDNAKPIRYFLTMEPHMDKIINNSSTFTGSVIIEIEPLKATNNITLHAKDLNITTESIKISNYINQSAVFKTSFDLEREFFIIQLEEELLEGEHYNVTIGEFSGNLSRTLVGFFLGNYQNSEGEERHFAITDFEPSDARRAFPCFDQPDKKAKFSISLIRTAGYNSLSNENLTSTELLENGRFKDNFKETSIIPTYVVAFLVSDFSSTPQIDRFRIFARPEVVKSGSLAYALSIAEKILPLLEEFTGINYPNSKMDQIALPPEHFKSEGMENWGLITFREAHLEISNETSTPADIQRCTLFIAHEFGHQWFGNLVTFEDWQYLWLSEGFASYIQYYIASLLKPEWQLMEQFVVEVVDRAFIGDKKPDTQAMNYQIKHIGEIPSPYISYMKAGSVIRMIHHFLTTEIFQKGLQIYLKTNQFSSVRPIQLYKALQEAVNEKNAHGLLGNHSVIEILETWDSNLGYPLVTATRNYETGDVTFSQNCFIETEQYDAENAKDDEDVLWYIPVSYALEKNNNFSDTTADFWLDEKSFTVKNLSSDGWFLVNKLQTGLFRTNYDLTNWNRLAEFLNTEEFNKMHVVNRAQLIRDAFNFAQIGLIPYSVPLNITKYLKRETDYISVITFLEAAKPVGDKLAFSKMYGVFKDYMFKSLSKVYEHLGLDEKPIDTHTDRLNRKNVLACLCHLGHTGCRNHALEKTRKWLKSDKLSLSPDMTYLIVRNAMRIAPPEDWDNFYHKVKNTTSEDVLTFVEALACTENKTILIKALDDIAKNLTFAGFKGVTFIRAVPHCGAFGIEVALEYLKNNPDFPDNYRAIVANELSKKISTQQQIDQLEALHNKTNFTWHEYSIKMMNRNRAWMDKGYLQQIEEWFLEYERDDAEESNIILDN